MFLSLNVIYISFNVNDLVNVSISLIFDLPFCAQIENRKKESFEKGKTKSKYPSRMKIR